MGLQQRGYRVIASARKSRDVEQLAAAGLEAVVLDLADSGSIQRAVDRVLCITDNRLMDWVLKRV
jgi:uncharacterized protein YbjT (DUF2867 family)